MKWVSVISATALVATGSAAIADMLVVRAVGPSVARFKPGQKLRDTTRVTIAVNDQLILLDAKGIKTLRGPGTFTVSAPASAAPTRLTAITGIDERRARVGAVRSPREAPPVRPDIWYLDTAAPGRMCLVDTSPTLWRGAVAAAGTTTIEASGGQRASVTWLAGQSTQPWPASLPLADGARITLRGAGTIPGGTVVTLKLLAGAPVEVQQLASALIAAGCQAQVDTIIAAAGGN